MLVPPSCLDSPDTWVLVGVLRPPCTTRSGGRRTSHATLWQRGMRDGATAHAIWDVLATHFCGCSLVRCHAPSLSHPGSGSGSIFMRDIAPTVRGTLRLSHNLPAEDDLRPDPLPSGCVSSCRHLVELRSTLTRCGPLKVGSRATRTAKNSTTHTERTKYIVTVPRTLAGQCWNRSLNL